MKTMLFDINMTTDHTLTPEKIQQICSTTTLEYNDTVYKFQAKQHSDGLYLHIDGNAPDTRDNTNRFNVTWRWPIPSNVTRPQLIKTIYKATLEMITHEIEHCLKFDGEPIFESPELMWREGVTKAQENES